MATVYAGRQPITRLGHNQFHLLDFALRYPGWHSFRSDVTTRRTVKSLVRKKVIEVNEFNQFRFHDTRSK